MRVLVVATILVVIASIAGWWFWMYGPARDQQAALETEIIALESAESQLANQRQQLLDLQARAPELRMNLDRLSQFVPPDPDQASFLELLQLAGNASGITFTALSFTEPEIVLGAPPASDPRLALGAISVTGTIDSSYFQLVDFLRRIEVAVPRAVLVHRVNVTQSAEGYPQVTTTFQARMFALVAAPVGPVPDPAVPAEPGVTPTPAPEGTAPPVLDTAPGVSDPAQSDVEDGAAPADEQIQTSTRPGDDATALTGVPA